VHEAVEGHGFVHITIHARLSAGVEVTRGGGDVVSAMTGIDRTTRDEPHERRYGVLGLRHGQPARLGGGTERQSSGRSEGEPHEQVDVGPQP
jgi:hypothetical protein